MKYIYARIYVHLMSGCGGRVRGGDERVRGPEAALSLRGTLPNLAGLQRIWHLAGFRRYHAQTLIPKPHTLQSKPYNSTPKR